tara:strand:- start:53 stop:613 length:561 start_codon:yes stop_codon:yes gene_type:complete
MTSDYGTFDIFKLSIFKGHVENWQDNKAEILSMLDDVTPYNGQISDFQTHHQKGIKPKYTKRLMEVLDGVFCDFEDVFPYAYEIRNIWCQRYEESAHHGIHNHGAVGYSMVFYAQFDKNCHQGTTFISPFNNWLNGNAIYHTIDVDEGDVVFFPSFILHECIPVKNNDKERIIFSLNMNVEEPQPE